MSVLSNEVGVVVVFVENTVKLFVFVCLLCHKPVALVSLKS